MPLDKSHENDGLLDWLDYVIPFPMQYRNICISNAISSTIISIVNLSITTGTFPSTSKSSIISPLLKNPSLNKEHMSNYRPIANLFFISKLTEKIVKKRLLDHLTSNSLLSPFQSAYTKFYSTETKLLSIRDYLSNAISMQQVSCLFILDLSAAFDTLDYSNLLHRLSTWFGIFSVSLQWLTSYISSRTSTAGILHTVPLHPLLPEEFHKAPFSAQFFSIFIPLLLALSSVLLLYLTSYMLMTHNSSYLLFLNISRLL